MITRCSPLRYGGVLIIYKEIKILKHKKLEKNLEKGLKFLII